MLDDETISGQMLDGRYRVERPIARGGVGIVYAATQEPLGRRVALKVLKPLFASDPSLLERLRREAEAAAALGHPNIVQVTDFVEPGDGPPFLVMEFLEGWSLASELDARPRMEPDRLVRITSQVLSALDAAHRAGIVHRDLKPANIFLQPLSGGIELAKLLDFGVAKLKSSREYQRLTVTGAIVGTPKYMSPEQIRGDAVDARTDIYSLGVMMYRALAGEAPFDASSFGRLARAINFDVPVPLGDRVPGLPSDLLRTVDRAMQRRPVDRYSSAREMLQQLTGGNVWPGSAEAPTATAREIGPPSGVRTTPSKPAPGADDGPTVVDDTRDERDGAEDTG